MNFVKEACLRLESIYGNLGETAIDFALDNGGKLWFIECNATSTKLAYLVGGSPPQVRKQAFINPLEYSRYLHHGSSGR